MNVEILGQRLATLRQERESRETQLRALEQREGELKETLFRINGTIAVLEDMLAEERAGGG